MSRHTDQMAWADQTEQRVLDTALTLSDSGWGGDLAIRAGAKIGLSAAEVALLLPNGSRDLAALLSRRHDDRAMATLGALDVASLKIRERIARAVSARLEAGAADEAAEKRAAGFLALPINADLAMALWKQSGVLLSHFRNQVAPRERNTYTAKGTWQDRTATATLVRGRM